MCIRDRYDPNRTANIALVHYTDGVKAYIIAPKGLEVGQRIVDVYKRQIIFFGVPCFGS